MILTYPQIKEIIKNNPNKALINKAIEYSKKMRRHIYGEGLDKEMKPIDGFEKQELRDLRVKYSKSNKDLFSRLGRPIDKVFSAKGGSVYYNLSDEQDNRAKMLSQDVRNGLSVRKWIEMFWKPHMLDDPAGLLFMEIMTVQEAVLAKQQGRSVVFPTYKSSSTIFDYLPRGNRLEYVIFRVDNKAKKNAGISENDIIYRVVDDAFDYWIKAEGEEIIVLRDHSFANYFGEVPAIINSDLANPEAEHAVLSFYDEIIELADQFLLKGSIKVTHDFLHGFPKYSEFADDCPTCMGNKLVNSEPCKDCRGTGKKIMIRVSDSKLLTWPSKEDPVILPNQVGGYISPDKTYYEISTADLQALEDAMNVTLWGMQSRLQAKGPSGSASAPQTATEIMDEAKPQSDRLHVISEMAEARHKFIMDMVIRINISSRYTGSSINYGRRYLLEGPDAIWEKYSKARTAGCPQNVLDDLLNEYYDAKYQSDPVGLATAKKLMYVEPFVHYTAAQLKTLDPSPEDYKAKLYYSEWLSNTNESKVLMMTVDHMKEDLAKFIKDKELAQPKEPIAA